MAQTSQYLYFVLQQVQVGFAYLRQFYHFDGVLRVGLGPVMADVHLAAEPAAYQVIQVIRIIPDPFFGVRVIRLLELAADAGLVVGGRKQLLNFEVLEHLNSNNYYTWSRECYAYLCSGYPNTLITLS